MPYAVLAALLLLFNPSTSAAASPGERYVLADFDSDDSSPVLGVSVKNPLDNEQSLLMGFVKGGPQLQEGRFLYLDYDVDSFQPAKGFFWLKLNNADISGFDTLHLYLRADPESGGSKNVTVQFTDASYRRSSYILTGITEQWKEFTVPLKRFSRIRNWSAMKEFVIVLDDVYSIPKKGRVFVDEIFVSKSEK